jgi:hypothetical protein
MLRIDETKSRGLVVTTRTFRAKTLELSNTPTKQKHLLRYWRSDCAQKIFSSFKTAEDGLVWGVLPGEKFQTIPTLYQCGLNVFPVSSSVFRRERIRGHPSAQAA